MCRLRRTEQCAALFARWQLDRPGSPRLRKALDEVRQINRASRRDLAPGNLRQLRMLYEGRIPDVDGAIRAGHAERLTQRFLRHYHHPVPFDRRVIEAAWSRCNGDDCEDRRRKAWQQLGSLDADVSALSDTAAPSNRGRTPSAWDAEAEDASEEDDRLVESGETE
jgi:hypothetical protein